MSIYGRDLITVTSVPSPRIWSVCFIYYQTHYLVDEAQRDLSSPNTLTECTFLLHIPMMQPVGIQCSQWCAFHKHWCKTSQVSSSLRVSYCGTNIGLGWVFPYFHHVSDMCRWFKSKRVIFLPLCFISPEAYEGHIIAILPGQWLMIKSSDTTGSLWLCIFPGGYQYRYIFNFIHNKHYM